MSTALVYIVSRGVCRIVATTALFDGSLYSSTQENAVATLDRVVLKAVRISTDIISREKHNATLIIHVERLMH